MTYTDFRTETADFLGWTRTSGNWNADRSARLNAIVKAAYLQFVYPPIAPGETVAYRWSFLRPTETFSTVASQYRYIMPPHFGAIVGDLNYSNDEDIHRIIQHTTPGMIDRNRSVDDAEGRPYLFALRPSSADQTKEQITELMLYPTPDAVYGIVYHFDVKVVDLSSTNPHPLGGQAHFETIMQSCRDIAAARYKDDPAGREHVLFLERLRASIESDRRNSPQTIGINDDNQRITYTRHGTEFAVRHGSMP